MSQRQIPSAHFGISPQSPAINKSAPEEEISLLLGTLQVPRGRSTSVTQGAMNKAVTSPKEMMANGSGHKDLVRSSSENKPGQNSASRTRKASSSSLRDGAEEFFIDVILARHARKLLSQCRLFDLGTFAAHLDFHMVAWMKKESTRAAKIEDAVTALKKVHTGRKKNT